MIYGMLRIKNEARWIERVLLSILPVCEHVFVLDDHSSDDTVAMCRSFDKVTLFESTFEGVNEVRDKNFLIERLEQHAESGDWILHIDGDEEVAPGSLSEIRSLAEGAS